MGKFKQTEKSRLSKTRQDFLKTFFNKLEHKTYKEVNGYILWCHWNGNSQDFEIAIYTPQSFKLFQQTQYAVNNYQEHGMFDV